MKSNEHVMHHLKWVRGQPHSNLLSHVLTPPHGSAWPANYLKILTMASQMLASFILLH